VTQQSNSKEAYCWDRILTLPCQFHVIYWGPLSARYWSPCTKMIDAVCKLIIFVKMLYRITKTSRNERVTLRVYNTYPTRVRCMRPWSHGTDTSGSLICKLQYTKRFLLRSRHFLFVTIRTGRGGSGIAHAIKTWIPAVSFHMGNILLRAFPKPIWPLETAPIILGHGV
jgi:hypothetical protein